MPLRDGRRNFILLSGNKGSVVGDDVEWHVGYKISTSYEHCADNLVEFEAICGVAEAIAGGGG